MTKRIKFASFFLPTHGTCTRLFAFSRARLLLRCLPAAKAVTKCVKLASFGLPTHAACAHLLACCCTSLLSGCFPVAKIVTEGLRVIVSIGVATHSACMG